jgi:hypothetical protein
MNAPRTRPRDLATRAKGPFTLSARRVRPASSTDAAQVEAIHVVDRCAICFRCVRGGGCGRPGTAYGRRQANTRRTANTCAACRISRAMSGYRGPRAERAELDRVVTVAIEERSCETRVSPRSLLPYLKSPETALRMAQSIATWFATGAPITEKAGEYAGIACSRSVG